MLGKTGRNFAAGMSGGIAYVYDPDGQFARPLQHGDGRARSRSAPTPADGDDARPPRQRARQRAEDSGMGDMLRFDAERLRILVERHLLHTGSARARALLDDWDNALAPLRQGDADRLSPRADASSRPPSAQRLASVAAE